SIHYECLSSSKNLIQYRRHTVSFLIIPATVFPYSLSSGSPSKYFSIISDFFPKSILPLCSMFCLSRHSEGFLFFNQNILAVVLGGKYFVVTSLRCFFTPSTSTIYVLTSSYSYPRADLYIAFSTFLSATSFPAFKAS